MNKRQSKGYWADVGNVRAQLDPLIHKYGRFPSGKEMIKEGLSSLAKAISEHHGGVPYFAKKIGVPTYDEAIGRNHQYTWTKDLVIQRYQDYVRAKNIDYYPSRIELQKEGNKLYTGVISIFGNYRKFKELLAEKCFVLKPKPRATRWTWEVAVRELEPIIKKTGYFPSQSDLTGLGLDGLRGYIVKHGLNERLKQHFSVSSRSRKYTVSRPPKHWFSEKNIFLELEKIYLHYGRIPSQSELIRLGYGSLHNHIKRLPEQVLEQFGGFKNSCLIKSKDGHYIRSIYELIFDNFLSHNNIAHETEGLISKTIGKNYRYDFKLALTNSKLVYVEIWGYTRNRNKFERKYHEKRLQKERIYHRLNLPLLGIEADIFSESFASIYRLFTRKIRSIDPCFYPKPINLDYILWGSQYSEQNIVTQLKELTVKNGGYFPSTGQLRLLDCGEGLITRMQKFGGAAYFKTILGADTAKKESKWNLEYLRGQLIAINQGDYVPSVNELKAMGRLDVLGGIQKNGGFKVVARKLQIPLRSDFLTRNPKPSRSKWTQERLVEELRPIVNHFGNVPSESQLIKLGKGGLVFAIKRNGGFVRIKEVLKLKSSRKKWDEHTVIAEIDHIIKTTRVFPTAALLQSMKKGGLVSGINSLGGFNYFRDKLGYPPEKYGRKVKTYSFEDVAKEMRDLSIRIGYFPSSDDLARINKAYLNSRIQMVGGFQKLRMYLGHPLRKTPPQKS